MANTQALWYFESVNLYNILCPHKTKDMGEKHEFRSYKRDQVIYRPDEPSEFIYMVAGGRVKIGHYLEDGKEVVKAILSKGEIFGELALAGEDKRTDFAQAMDSDTVICPMSIDDLKALMWEDKELS